VEVALLGNVEPLLDVSFEKVIDAPGGAGTVWTRIFFKGRKLTPGNSKKHN